MHHVVQAVPWQRDQPAIDYATVLITRHCMMQEKQHGASAWRWDVYM